LAGAAACGNGLIPRLVDYFCGILYSLGVGACGFVEDFAGFGCDETVADGGGGCHCIIDSGWSCRSYDGGFGDDQLFGVPFIHQHLSHVPSVDFYIRNQAKSLRALNVFEQNYRFGRIVWVGCGWGLIEGVGKRLEDELTGRQVKGLLRVQTANLYGHFFADNRRPIGNVADDPALRIDPKDIFHDGLTVVGGYILTYGHGGYGQNQSKHNNNYTTPIVHFKLPCIVNSTLKVETIPDNATLFQKIYWGKIEERFTFYANLCMYEVFP
jgi:hypothetical protein